MSFINSSDFWNNVNTPTGFYANDDGSISYNDNVLNNWFNPSQSANQQYVLEWNRDNQRYQQEWNQYLKEYEYNKSLSERQQALSEESYYNGIRNQASQLASLGINPATEGSSLSSSAMSGGSSVGSTRPSGSPSAGRSAQASQIFNMLGTLISLGTGISQMKVNDASAKKLEADANMADSSTRFTDAQTTALSLENERNLANNETFKRLGVSEAEYRTLENVSFSAQVASEIASSLGISVSPAVFSADMSASGSSSSSKSVSGAALALFLNGEDKNIKGDKLFKAISDYKPKMQYSNHPDMSSYGWTFEGKSSDGYNYRDKYGSWHTITYRDAERRFNFYES